MTVKCSQCKLPFRETSIQIFNRLKSKSPKICKDCTRINRAESTAEKRKEDKAMSFEDVMEKVLLKELKKDGFLSIPYIMRKFKLSYESAKEWKEKLEAK